MVDLVHFGYFFFPSTYRPPLGYAGFDAYLSHPRTDWYFDTQAATFAVATEDAIRHVRIAHPWPQSPERLRVVFGRFYILAHNGELVEGCSFGGDLEIVDYGTYTSCHLTSLAPIFDLENPNGFIAILEPEIEAELARLRAEWSGSDTEFDRRLASLDPATFFVASLDFIDKYLHSLRQAADDDQIMDVCNALHRAIHKLKDAGEWPEKVPVLRELILEPV